MGDETANSMNLDLNLGPIPEPGDDFLNGSLSLEEFISGFNRLRGRLGQREIHFPREISGFDRVRELSSSHHRERLRREENRSLRRSENLDHIQDIVTRMEHRRSFWNRARVLPEAAITNDSELMNIPLITRNDALELVNNPLITSNDALELVNNPLITSNDALEFVNIPLITRNDALELVNNPLTDPSSSFISGEASVTPAERDTELMKVTEKNNEINVEDEKLKEKGNEDQGKDDDTGSFFDCNICFDLAKEPVVTICGHLFCWPCVYQWLHIHSVANECPVCKGEVNMKNVIPIYGRGNIPCGPEHDPLGVKIPVRPHAPRVESVRQSIRRGPVSFSMDELVRRLSERRVAAWRDQPPPAANEPLSRDASSERMTSRERMISYFLGRDGREEQPPPLDDRDSVSSRAAIIQSESQTIDTVLEIDSYVSLSTSTSRRRNANEASRVSDVDSGDSRARRRRRINEKIKSANEENKTCVCKVPSCFCVICLLCYSPLLVMCWF